MTRGGRRAADRAAILAANRPATWVNPHAGQLALAMAQAEAPAPLANRDRTARREAT